jgi:hypothetical protein
MGSVRRYIPGDLSQPLWVEEWDLIGCTDGAGQSLIAVL